MKVSLTFSGSRAELWTFSDPKHELLIYITNPFKIGIGYKYRVVNRDDIGVGGYINPNTCNVENNREYYMGNIKTFRFWRHPKVLKFMHVSHSANIMVPVYDDETLEELKEEHRQLMKEMDEDYTNMIMEGINA